jgi:hypothetical protein
VETVVNAINQKFPMFPQWEDFGKNNAVIIWTVIRIRCAPLMMIYRYRAVAMSALLNALKLTVPPYLIIGC